MTLFERGNILIFAVMIFDLWILFYRLYFLIIKDFGRFMGLIGIIDEGFYFRFLISLWRINWC